MQSFIVGCIDDSFKGYMVKEISHGVPESTLPNGRYLSVGKPGSAKKVLYGEMVPPPTYMLSMLHVFG